MLPHLRKRIVITKDNYEFSGVGHPFNPRIYDSGNLIALYDGDIGATPGAWNDSKGFAPVFNLTLFNAPGIILAAINGHTAVRFNGINQYGFNNNALFLTTQPYTIYLVYKTITWVFNSEIFEDGNVANAKALIMSPASPQLRFFCGAILNPNPIPVINNYEILTMVANGANSEIRTNNNVAVIGNAGASNGRGLVIAASKAPANFSNIEISYIIIRNGADNTATQNLFINYLKNRFAL
jgi:hypothetical protein